MNMPSVMLLSWAGLAALSLLASGLIVLAELRFDEGALVMLATAHASAPASVEKDVRATSCEQ